MKVVENSPETHEIAPFFKIFLGEHAPKPPLQRLAASLLATCISKIQEILKLGPPPLKNPAYAPVYIYDTKLITSLYGCFLDWLALHLKCGSVYF